MASLFIPVSAREIRPKPEQPFAGKVATHYSLDETFDVGQDTGTLGRFTLEFGQSESTR